MSHTEKHVAASAWLRDLVIGLSDGLTVPFALAAGLTGAVSNTGLIVIAGLAEIAAGAISMGLGGYLAARTERDYYDSEEKREYREVEVVPHVEEKEVADIFREFGVPEEHLAPVVAAICEHPRRWVDFMMRFELGLEKPNPRRLVSSPMLIGGSYAVGGMIPLFPYMVIPQSMDALRASIVLTALALLAFGAFKGHFTGQKMLKSAIQTALIGGAAAAAAYGIARVVS